MHSKIYTCILLAFALFNHAAAQLSSKTSREIQLLLNEKNTRTDAQKKIDSKLLQFIREKRGQKMVAGVDLEAVKIQTTNNGNVMVDIQADVSDNLLSEIEALGGKIIFSSSVFHSIRAEISLNIAEKIADLSKIKFIEPAALPTLEGSTEGRNLDPGGAKTAMKKLLPPKSKTSFEDRANRTRTLVQRYLDRVKASSPMFAGAAHSEGDRTHRADDARNTYGYQGQGVRIGVLSDSYNALGAAPADVINGDLPGPGNPLGNTTPVTVLQDLAGRTDEGRAMVQIVHDLAPKAQLFFATASISPASFASNIIALRNAPYNCDIIIDDVSWSNETAFYDGLIAQAVNTVTANGAMYFSSAGNAGSKAKNTSGAYEADFNDTGSPVFNGSAKVGTVHNFGTVANPADGDSITTSGSFYALFWADPPGASNNDYDLFLVSSNGTIKASSTNIQNGSQNPFEQILTPPALVAGDRLVVFKTASAAQRAFHLSTSRGKLKFSTNGQTYGHSSAADAYSVAATPASTPFSAPTPAGPFPGAFSSTNQVETFSSDGPRRIFFNANGTAVTPGNFLFSTNGGIVRPKPDITAANGVATTLPAGSGLNPFYGTSAAAPHAGAIAGLLKSANPALSPAEIRTILTTTTVDIESPGYDELSGHGIIQAFQAMQLLNPNPQATLNLGTVQASEGSFSNNNGSIDPGEIVNLNINLSNPSITAATNINAILTTSTPGVTVIQRTSGYGNISASGSAVNAAPFVIAVGSSLKCGSVLSFALTTSLEGGVSPQGFQFTITIGSQPFIGGITSTLGMEPPSGAGYTVVSGQQTGRLVRGSAPSTCAVPVPNPGLTVTTGARQYDAYTFTNSNSTSQCVTVTLTSPNGGNLYTAAYNDTGFVPSNPSTHYIAEPGQSAITQSYSFNVEAGKPFTVVVHDVNVTPASNSPYTLRLSLSNCNAGPACTPVVITSETLSVGATGSPYNEIFSATGGSGNYEFSLTGRLPAGISFSGNTLSGTPTQAGTFPLTVVARDLTGCPADTNTYSLVIAGIPPASLTAVAGTPQTVFPTTAFPVALEAVVRDINNNPLSGVSVTFTAPLTGPRGTFAGGLTSVTLISDSNGKVTAPTFTANSTSGSYIVVASVVGVADAIFNLTNFCPVNFVVTSNADSGPGSLREIVGNVCVGTTITFDPSVTSIILTSGQIFVRKSLEILGPGASKLTISGNGNSRIFNIVTDAASIVSIAGLTVRDGKLRDTSVNGGAGILVTSGRLNLMRCSIINNDASLAQNAEGGGIDNEGGFVSIDRCTIANNTAADDGGGVASWANTMTITNSTIAGNTAGMAGVGGGILSNVPLALTNCTIFGNSAQAGGNIYRLSSTVTFKNNIIAGGTLVGSAGSGPDIFGTNFNSADYNLIQTTAGGTISGTTTHNITGLSPNLLPLENYGGELPTLLPQPTSPVINAGDVTLASSGTEQRGFPRVVGSQADIGAVEANYSVSATAGTPQTTKIRTPFTEALAARVTEYSNNIVGVPVFFSAPASGASGSFVNSSTKDTALTNLSGIATAKTFSANDAVGSYNDTASIGSAFPFTTFALTNVLGDEVPLPLVFGSITASATDCLTKIEWKTLTELNSKDFTVEYSTDGLFFKPLTTLPAKGNSATIQLYSYMHASTVDGVNYYRIKQTDNDGSFTYSNVLIVTSSCGKQPIVAYPNPVKNKLTVILPGTEKRILTIFDAGGRKVMHQVVNGGPREINASNWTKGIYALVITQKGKANYVLKFIKN